MYMMILAHLSLKLKCAFLIACLLSVCRYVCLSLRKSVCVNISHFQPFSPELLNQFQPQLPPSILGLREFKHIQMKDPPFSRKDNNEIMPMPLYKNILLKNHLANFNQTWYKSPVSEGNWSMFKRRVMTFFQREIIKN